MTDNKRLKYLLDQPKLNVRQARWLAFLNEYDFEIQHIKGKENKVVDQLAKDPLCYLNRDHRPIEC